MKLFKTIGIAMLALSMCTGCTSYKERVKADNKTEEVNLKIEMVLIYHQQLNMN